MDVELEKEGCVEICCRGTCKHMTDVTKKDRYVLTSQKMDSRVSESRSGLKDRQLQTQNQLGSV